MASTRGLNKASTKGMGKPVLRCPSCGHSANLHYAKRGAFGASTCKHKGCHCRVTRGRK